MNSSLHHPSNAALTRTEARFSQRSGLPVSATRRALIAAAGGLGAGLGWPAFASEKIDPRLSAIAAGLRPALPSGPLTDLSVRVSARRLDESVARVFGDFNKPAILPAFDPGRHGARHDVELHRLVVPLVVTETGESVTLSGLLALPVGASGPLPVVSWQHGTILSFGQVPSNLLKLSDPAYAVSDSGDSLETLLNIQRFAGQGFAVIAADYVGKGPFRNGRGEAYGVKDVSVQTCLRMLEAGLTAMASRGLQVGPLFLNGWSQGAVNTQWLHQALRGRGVPIAATSVASPFNELAETLRFWAGAQTYPSPPGATPYPESPAWISLCLIVLLGSYELNYGFKGLLENAVAPQFRAFAARYWKTYDLRVDSAEPFPSGSNLLVPGFFDRFTHETNSAFLRQVAANTATFWRYDSPIRFHIGLADEGLHPTLAARALAAGGPQTTAVMVPQASHRATFLASLYGSAASLSGQDNVLECFNTLRQLR